MSLDRGQRWQWALYVASWRGNIYVRIRTPAFEAREPLIDGLLMSVDTFYAEVPRLLKAGSAPAAKKRRPTQPLAQGQDGLGRVQWLSRTSGTWSSASSLTNGSSSPAPCVVGNRRRVRWLRLGRRRR
jgi:hypothetical protein